MPPVNRRSSPSSKAVESSPRVIAIVSDCVSMMTRLLADSAAVRSNGGDGDRRLEDPLNITSWKSRPSRTSFRRSLSKNGDCKQGSVPSSEQCRQSARNKTAAFNETESQSESSAAYLDPVTEVNAMTYSVGATKIALSPALASLNRCRIDTPLRKHFNLDKRDEEPNDGAAILQKLGVPTGDLEHLMHDHTHQDCADFHDAIKMLDPSATGAAERGFIRQEKSLDDEQHGKRILSAQGIPLDDIAVLTGSRFCLSQKQNRFI